MQKKSKQSARRAQAGCSASKCLPPQELKTLAEQLDAFFFRALAEPIRLELIQFLILRGPLDVESIAENFSQDYSVISRHLAALRDSGLVLAERQGRRVVYSIHASAVINRLERLLECIRSAVRVCCPEQLQKSK